MDGNHADDGGLIATRWSTEGDEQGLAEIHASAWRFAYAGIIPGLTIERLISRRGPSWWGRMHDRGYRALLIDCDDVQAGYATLGRSRLPGDRHRGEIYELYLRPEYQGCGLGRRLFGESRRQLAQHGLDSLIVWALADNTIGCRFYTALGGIEAARQRERFAGVPLERIGFAWD